ncbi:hypothetical protein OG800_48520 [Streptomyces sp. NBC_00445]|uniref:hypothetical protein n=1 Tax=Streptomyces sp. NBC_00445 TaxID=2975745 RepID=UPI002E24AC4C
MAVPSASRRAGAVRDVQSGVRVALLVGAAGRRKPSYGGLVLRSRLSTARNHGPSPLPGLRGLSPAAAGYPARRTDVIKRPEQLYTTH